MGNKTKKKLVRSKATKDLLALVSPKSKAIGEKDYLAKIWEKSVPDSAGAADSSTVAYPRKPPRYSEALSTPKSTKPKGLRLPKIVQFICGKKSGKYGISKKRLAASNGIGNDDESFYGPPSESMPIKLTGLKTGLKTPMAQGQRGLQRLRTRKLDLLKEETGEYDDDDASFFGSSGKKAKAQTPKKVGFKDCAGYLTPHPLTFMDQDSSDEDEMDQSKLIEKNMGSPLFRTKPKGADECLEKLKNVLAIADEYDDHDDEDEQIQAGIQELMLKLKARKEFYEKKLEETTGWMKVFGKHGERFLKK